MSATTPPPSTNVPNAPEPASWSRGQKAGVLVIALSIAALLPAAYRMVRPFLTAMVLAAILAVVLDPLQKRVGRFISRSSVAALITTVVAVGPILALVFFAGVVIEREIKAGAFSGILRAGQRLTASAPIDAHAIQQAAAQLSQVAGDLFTVAMAVLFLYVLLVHGQSWLVQSTALLPLDAAVTNRILATMRDAIVANVNGIVAVSAAEAVLFGIIFWVAGTGSPILWGALAGLASMVPVVGGMVVWLPMAVTLAVHRAWARALLVALGCLAGQTAVAELLRPKVVGSRLRQPPLLIALSVLGATNAFGAMGILVGPVIVSVLAALVREFRVQLLPETQSINTEIVVQDKREDQEKRS
jgi:predicted PurR-regulated permease PerM